MSDTYGHQVARKLYKLGECEFPGCDLPAVDRHHKDGDSSNNEPENIERLCRGHHMVRDGRIEVLREHNRRQPKQEPKPCSNCKRPAKPLRKGRCGACKEYLRRTGRERPVDADGNPLVKRFIGRVKP